MSILTDLKEKVVNTLTQNGSKSYEEELQHLDNLIEDLFKMDEETLHVVSQKESSQNS
ncbi:MAG: hypothetical protein P8Y60_01015 [Calditrichota bacterium]|jgi:hypothetical protein